MSTKYSKRKSYVAIGITGGAILLWIAAQLMPTERPSLAFGVLRYTNEPSGTFALFTITNAGDRAYRMMCSTQLKSRETWTKGSALGPEMEVLPARAMRTFKIQLPSDSPAWRLECRLWRMPTRLPRKINEYCDRLGLPRIIPTGIRPKHPQSVVMSPEFRR